MTNIPVEIIRQGIITTEYDLTDLDIIDWARYRGYWRHPGDAIRSIASWFLGRALYTVIECDMRQAPKRSDWPGWGHGGHHDQLGRLYWNVFHTTQHGVLHFHDQPDFSGTLDLRAEGKGQIRFWGDIGYVSAITFAHIQKKMKKHDLWISISAFDVMILIEALDDIQLLWEEHLRGETL